jgi:hypothetical protein
MDRSGFAQCAPRSGLAGLSFPARGKRLYRNYFSILKRDIIGTFHHVSEAHLHRYTGEFDFRYNTRKMTDAERMALSIPGIVGKRLTYRRTNGAAKAQA